MSSLLGSICFVFNFSSRKSKQTLIASKNKEAKNIFSLKSKLNQHSVIDLSD